MRQFWMFCLMALIVGCGDATTLRLEDGPNDRALSEKSDSQLTPCHVEAVLALVNSDETTEETLYDLGVHRRAAKSIMTSRKGADGVAGTDDDLLFDSILSLDAVYFVGPRAMEQLVHAVDAGCVDDGSSMGAVDVVFSPQPYGTSHLARMMTLIAGAERSIDIAMYSFWDTHLLDELDAAVQRGVKVRFLFHSALQHKQSPSGTTSESLEAIGVDVRYINKVMHHKFALIDGPQDSMDQAPLGILASGSGNWSYSAGTKYDENTLFIYHNTKLNLLFQDEFNHLWSNSRDLMLNQALTSFESVPVDENWIPTDTRVEAYFTSNNFKTYVSNTYGPTFSVVAGKNHVADQWVRFIEEAKTSIHIASGHLRSRPIAQALLIKHAADPDVDIRVYLDGQEYTSEWVHEAQLAKLETCVAQASASVSRTQKCMDVGFRFSYSLHEAGIDVRFKHYAYRWHYTYAPQMHHKYMLIDGELLVTGSYNLSDNAEHNTMENIMVFRGADFLGLNQAFEINFEILWRTGELDDRLAQLRDSIAHHEGQVLLTYPAMALTTPEIASLKKLIKVHCPQVDSEAFRKDPQAHKVCTP